MIFTHITVNNFGSVRSFDTDLTPAINIIDTYFAPEFSAAIEFLICNKRSQATPKAWLRKDTRIVANVCINGKIYTLNASPCGEQLALTAIDFKGNDVTDFYKDLLSHCLEQDATESFNGQDKSLPLRLCWYRNPEDQDILEDLPGRTGRILNTKAFRTHLVSYIRTFQSEPVNCQKQYQVRINRQGQFEVFHPGVSGEVFLSATEERLFLYICFLNIAAFWVGIEKVRNFHHEEKPLLIQNFLEYLDDSTDISGLIARTCKLQRQVIILTSPLTEEEKKKWIGEHYERKQMP